MLSRKTERMRLVAVAFFSNLKLFSHFSHSQCVFFILHLFKGQRNIATNRVGTIVASIICVCIRKKR